MLSVQSVNNGLESLVGRMYVAVPDPRSSSKPQSPVDKPYFFDIVRAHDKALAGVLYNSHGPYYLSPELNGKVHAALEIECKSAFLF